MSDRPSLKRANYTLHIVTDVSVQSRLGSLIYRLENVQILDEVLELFETEPRFQHFVLNGEVGPLEDYLSIRPENFERIEQFVDEGKLLIGPWYMESYNSAETAIRSLMLGLRTADVFGRPMMVGYIPSAIWLPGYLPQIFKAFGIEIAIAGPIDATQPSELLWVGDDGTQIVVAQLQHGIVSLEKSISDVRASAAACSESGHIMIPYVWDFHQTRSKRLELLDAIPAMQKSSHDRVFHSNPAAYAKTIQIYAQTHPLPKIASAPDSEYENPAEFGLTRLLEPLVAWASAFEPSETDALIRRPQYLLQQLWKRYLNGADMYDIKEECRDLAELVLIDIAKHINTSEIQGSVRIVFNGDYSPIERDGETIPPLAFAAAPFVSLSDVTNWLNATDKIVIITPDIHGDSLPLSASLVTASEPQFRIIAAKLPEDPERTGLIVRGHNITDEDMWITLTPWRPYKIIDVVTMDEEPTGGRLAQESNGAVRFKAAPHRILTFWFHND